MSQRPRPLPFALPVCAAAALAALSPSAMAQQVNVGLASEAPALCLVTGAAEATAVTNVSASAETASGVTLRVDNIINEQGEAERFAATVAVPVSCNGVGTDYSVESVNGGLTTPVALTDAGAAASFDARALYLFTVTYNGQLASGQAAGPVDNGLAPPGGAAATGVNVGPFTGNVVIGIDGQPGQPLVAGVYTDTLRITITGQS